MAALDWFKMTLGGRQAGLVSLTLNIFLERIMTDALGHHEGTLSIGGKDTHQTCVLLMAD